MRTLAVIPSDPIEVYTGKGMSSLLEGYFNPSGFFDKVYLLSPKEKELGRKFGMEVVPTSAKELSGRIRQFNVDVVRAYGGYWAADMAVSGRVEGVPVVVSVHDTNPALLHGSVREADAVWCVSEAVRRAVLKRFGRPEATWLFSDRVDLGSVKPAASGSWDDLLLKYPGKYRILHIGRKEPQKNLDTLIRAMRLLGEDFFLLAIGRGNAGFYEGLAVREGVASRCAFLDAVENSEIPRYQAWAHCMCVPSRWEGFGIVFIEAMACRSVVVTSDTAPMNEYITHLKNGILVKDFEDPAALAEAARKACTDEKLRADIRSVARESVEKFDAEKVMEKEASFYARVLEMNTAGAFRRSAAMNASLLFAKAVDACGAVMRKIHPRVKIGKAGK